MAALPYQPEPRENSESAATTKQLGWLSGRNVAIPHWCLDFGLSRRHASDLIELLKQDAYTVKRPCRRCGGFRMAVPPGDDRHESYWGRPAVEHEPLVYICVECLLKPPREKQRHGPKAVPPPANRPPLVELLRRARGGTIPRTEPPSEWLTPSLDEFQPSVRSVPERSEPPPRLHAARKPTKNTLRLVEHLVGRFGGLLTEDMLADALLGRQVVVYRDGLRTSIELKADELPKPGPEILRTTAEEDFDSVRRLVADSFRMLEAQGKLRLDADGSWRVVERAEEKKRVGFESVADTGSQLLGIAPKAVGDDFVPDPVMIETYRRFREEIQDRSAGNRRIERLLVQGMVYEAIGAWNEQAWLSVSD